MATQNRVRIAAEPRSDVRKKSALKALRSAGRVPAVLFGHGDPQTVSLDAATALGFIAQHSTAAMFDVMVGGNAVPALIRHVDRDPINGRLLHLELQRVNLGETVRTSIPVTFHGEEELVRQGYVLERQLAEVPVHGRAEALPESFTIDVTDFEPGHSIRISELTMPQGVQSDRGEDEVIARVTGASVPADIAAALDAEELAHATAVIGSEEEKEMESDEEVAATVE